MEELTTESFFSWSTEWKGKYTLVSDKYSLHVQNSDVSDLYFNCSTGKRESHDFKTFLSILRTQDKH